MSDDFESIVRPFQLREVTPERRIAQTSGTTEQPNVKLAIGKQGQAKIFQCSAAESVTVYVEKFPKEK